MRSDRNPYLLHLDLDFTQGVQPAKEEVPYKIAVLKNFGNAFWFVFDRSGTVKVTCCESRKQAEEFVDQWDVNYET